MLTTLSAIDPEISEGIMAVGTAALAMLVLTTAFFGTWTAIQYLGRKLRPILSQNK